MLFKNPPAKNSKDEPNIIKITNRALHPDSEDGDKFEIPAEHFIYPQVESREEIDQITGGPDRTLEVFNDFLRDAALAEAKNKIRMASSGTEHDIIQAGIHAGRNFTFVEQARITAAEAKEKFSILRSLATENKLSEAELGAKLKELLGM